MRKLLLVFALAMGALALSGQHVPTLDAAKSPAPYSSLNDLAILAMIGLSAIVMWSAYRRKQRDSKAVQAMTEEIARLEDSNSHLQLELEAKDISLDLLNKKLLGELSEREKIEKTSFARDQFLATMSNEMRSPLNVITGLTYVLLKDNPRDDQAEQLRNLQFAANDLVVFINDMLDFSEIEAGKLNIQDREFSPWDVVAEVQKKFIQRAKEKDLLFNFYFDPRIPAQLLGDDARLGQILTNLLTHAFKNTQTGHVKTAVLLHEPKARETIIKITVQGTDGGTDRQTLEEMFRPQYKGETGFHAHDSQQFSLAITKRLVELQNGKIDVTVTEGECTLFSVLLPYKLAFGQEPGTKISQTPSTNRFEGAHVLVVEDNKINQLVVSKVLQRLGMKVSTANNGFEALDQVQVHDFDLIIMDIQMPGMDGYRATAEIRRHPDQNKRAVPIIALTASAFLTEKDKAVLFGMNDHVGKPFSPDELVEKIKVCLGAFKKA